MGFGRFGSNFVGQTDVKFEDSREQDDTTSPVQRNKKDLRANDILACAVLENDPVAPVAP